MTPRLIALLCVLEETVEKMVLTRAKRKVGKLNLNLYAYNEGKSTT